MKYSSLNLYNNPAVATHAITGSINDSSYKEFREFIKAVLENNQKSSDEERIHKEKEEFNKIHNPEAKPEFFSPKTKVQRINLIVDSYGGQCSSMTSIVALMNSSPIPIDTYCFGAAMSAGFMIFIHGKNRYVGNAADLMMHSLSTGVYDHAPGIKSKAEHLLKINTVYQQMVANKTGLTMEWLKEHEEKDMHFLADDCIEYKIADAIIEE